MYIGCDTHFRDQPTNNSYVAPTDTRLDTAMREELLQSPLRSVGSCAWYVFDAQRFADCIPVPRRQPCTAFGDRRVSNAMEAQLQGVFQVSVDLLYYQFDFPTAIDTAFLAEVSAAFQLIDDGGGMDEDVAHLSGRIVRTYSCTGPQVYRKIVAARTSASEQYRENPVGTY